MGMYTHVRGWLELVDMITMEEFQEILEKATDISPRSDACITCTTFNHGFNGSCYIFIGGEIKNYDDDWNIFINFLKNNFNIYSMRIEMKYEESDKWDIITNEPREIE